MQQRTARRVATIAAIVLGLFFVIPAQSASAHATLLFTNPPVDGAVPASPTAIELVFDRAVIPRDAVVTVSGATESNIPVVAPTGGSEAQALTIRLPKSLAPGDYRVEWQVTARDGDTMTGSFHFAVGTVSGLSSGAPTTSTRGAGAAGLARSLYIGGLALVLGGLVGQAIARRAGAIRPKRPWLVAGATLCSVGTAALTLQILGSGSWWQGLVAPRFSALTGSTPGRAILVELVGSLLCLVLLLLSRQRVAVLAVGATIVAEGVRSHPGTLASGWGSLSLAVHIAAAAIWVGALAHIVRLVTRPSLPRTWVKTALLAYARVALWLYLVVLATGIANGLIVVGLSDPIDALTGTTYGRVLLAKLALVLVVSGLAMWARRRLHAPTLPNSHDTPSGRGVGFAAGIEIGALSLVMAVSAGLSVLAPPSGAAPSLPFPPPAVGPVSAAGGRAGWVSINASASEGQLVLRLATPESDGAARGSTTFHVQGNLRTNRHADATRLSFQECGFGCFVAPTQWARGRSTLTLRADASGPFPGGDAALTINWPPTPRPSSLRRIVSAMHSVRTLVLHEKVTSNTRTGAGTPHVLRMSGSDFLNSEPYGSGQATFVDDVSTPSSPRKVSLAYPAQGVFVRLTLDSRWRPTRETLVAPNHLVERTFTYPQKPRSD